MIKIIKIVINANLLDSVFSVIVLVQRVDLKMTTVNHLQSQVK